MKAIMRLLAASVFVVGLVGCGGSNPISLVKGGTLAIDESVSVGAALEGYKYFDKQAWSKIEDSQGRLIVEFRGHLDFDQFVGAELEGVKLTEDVVQKGKAKLAEGHMDLTYVIQFAIGKDGETFEVKYSGLEMKAMSKDPGEVVSEDIPDDDLQIFRCIYSNQPEPSTFGLLMSAGLS